MFWYPWLLLPLWGICLALVIKYRYPTADLKKVAVWQPAATAVTVLIAVLSLLSPHAPITYTVGLLIGLGVSLVADMILVDIDNARNFLIGMALFCVAVLSYSIGIKLATGLQMWDLLTYGGAALFTVSVLAYLWSGLGASRMPLMAYMLLWGALLGSAYSTFFCSTFPWSRAVLLCAGVTIFMIADLMLAIYKYKWPIPQWWATVFYFAGQLLIALSLY